jgi:hypothetical protein
MCREMNVCHQWCVVAVAFSRAEIFFMFSASRVP